VDPETGAIPDGTDEQVAMAFANVRRLLAAAGGTVDDIVKCTVFAQDNAIRQPRVGPQVGAQHVPREPLA
jgi:2-iminobutanoate/2-iminopropanoate deaminase